MTTSTLEPPQTQTSWWHRNWKWLIPVMVMGALASVAAFVCLVFLLMSGVFKGSDAYATAMERVRAHPVLVRELGTPIETGWQFTGSIKINGPSGSADFSAPLHGPHGRGALYVTATKSADLWQYTVLASRRMNAKPEPRNSARSGLAHFLPPPTLHLPSTSNGVTPWPNMLMDS